MLQEGPSPVSGIAPSGDGRAVPGRRSFQSSFQYIELASIGHGGEPGILHQLMEDEFEVVHFLCSKRASRVPVAPPSTASSRLSTRSWRIIRPRPAPSAARMANSRARSNERASDRLAMFT